MDLKVDALRAKFQAEKLEAIATLEVYVKNAVGIGEHPQIIEEMAKLIDKIGEVNGALEALDEVFVKDGDDKTNVAQEGSVNS
mgnify:FL=1|tara:strand:- start:105 stop:353 length:249 start_codon:yes stop_codon:yes gene_type:complete